MGCHIDTGNGLKEDESFSRELSEAIHFLRSQFESNLRNDGNSFAKKLNNEAAVEMAEVLFLGSAVKQAIEELGY